MQIPLTRIVIASRTYNLCNVISAVLFQKVEYVFECVNQIGIPIYNFCIKKKLGLDKCKIQINDAKFVCNIFKRNINWKYTTIPYVDDAFWQI